jgi:hypothetical protein
MLDKMTVDALNRLFFQDDYDVNREGIRPWEEVAQEQHVKSVGHGPGAVNDMIIERDIQLPECSPDEKRRELELLRDNLDLILTKTNKIITQPDFFYCYIKAARLGLITFGTWQIPLGVLIQLWNDQSMVVNCPLCQGTLYIVGAGGSPLSGSNSCIGVCRSCSEIISTSVEEFPRIWQPLLSMRNKHRNTQKVLRKITRCFSWKDGIVGQKTPDIIVQEAIYGVSLDILIQNMTADKYYL